VFRCGSFLLWSIQWLGGVVVRAPDLWSRDREFGSWSLHCRVAYVNSAFHPSGVDKSSTGLLAGVKAGRDHVCRVAGNIVWSHTASDVPQLCDRFLMKSHILSFTHLFLLSHFVVGGPGAVIIEWLRWCIALLTQWPLFCESSMTAGRASVHQKDKQFTWGNLSCGIAESTEILFSLHDAIKSFVFQICFQRTAVHIQNFYISLSS